jgi:hypothetical protein
MLEDGAFALFASGGWPVARMLEQGGALRMARVDLEYLDDAVAGDDLRIQSWPVAHGADAAAASPRSARGPSEDARALACDDRGAPHAVRLLQNIARADGSRILRAASDWVWRRRPTILGGVPEA